MKAYFRYQYGSPEILRLEDTDVPVPTDEQVLVRVRASAINAHDWHMLRGKPYLARLNEGLRRPKERILGLDVAGIVEAVGANVTHVEPGDAVFGSRWGAFAEYVAGKNMVRIPEGISFEQAASVPTAGQTALFGLRDKGELQAGQRVLVNGAGGGVGTFAVQIARAMGAEVTAVTGTRSLDLLKSIGAHRVIDYRHEDFTRERNTYDLVLDVGGNRRLSRMRRTLRPDGRIVMVAPDPGNWVAPILRIGLAVITNRMGGKPARAFLAPVNRENLTALGEMLADGRVKPVIERTFPFDRIPDAIRHVEDAKAQGKVVITVS